jgi:hypothetical protein
VRLGRTSTYGRHSETSRLTRVAIDFGARWSSSCEGSAWAERLEGAKKEVTAIVARGVRASSHETGERARAARRRVEDRCSLALQSRTAPPGGAVTGAFRGWATALSCPRERRQLHGWRGRRRSAPGNCMSGRVARGDRTPGLPQNPGVTVSRHRALLTGTSVRADPPPLGEQAGLSVLQPGPPPLEPLEGPQPSVLLPSPAPQVGADAPQEGI